MTSRLLDDLDPVPGRESVTTVAEFAGVRIERIVSLDYASPEGFWYDQPDHEWVTVLAGEGAVEFEDGRVVRLGQGDSLHIAPRRRHRVAFTDPASPTVWLAVRAPSG